MHTMQGLKYHKYSEGVTGYTQANIKPIYSRKFGKEVWKGSRNCYFGGKLVQYGTHLVLLQHWLSLYVKTYTARKRFCTDLKSKLPWCTSMSVCKSTTLWIFKCSVWADNNPFPYQLCFGFHAHCQRAHSWELHTGHVKNYFFIYFCSQVLFSNRVKFQTSFQLSHL